MWLAQVHFDAELNLFCQLHGNKTVLLYPPQRHRAMRLHPEHSANRRQGGVEWSLSSQAAESPPPEGSVVASLAPGDLLVLPPQWFHQITSESESTSLSLWVEDRFTQTPVLATLRAIPLPFEARVMPCRSSPASRFMAQGSPRAACQADWGFATAAGAVATYLSVLLSTLRCSSPTFNFNPKSNS